MDKKSKENLYAICSYLETFSPKFVDNLIDAFYQAEEKMNENGDKTQDEILEPLKNGMETRLFSFLKDKPEEKPVGFSFCVQQLEKKELMKEVIKEVKENSLLTKTLTCLNNAEDLPLNEDEKITFVLSSLEELPPMHHQISARLVLPVLNEQTGKKGKKTLPVKVVVANNKIVNIALDEEKINSR